MLLSTQAQAILLLNARLNTQAHQDATPLTTAEWGRFALFLRETGRTPADLIESSCLAGVISDFHDKTVTAERIGKLLSRSTTLAIAVEKWQRAGLWIMTRADTDYPKRLKQRLKHNAPPIFFGAGNRHLLNQGGIAVVGSRALDAGQLAFTEHLGGSIAHQGKSVISGGARGADQAAMLGALQAAGTAIGIVADSLLRACTSTQYRTALMHNDLVLLSPFHPEACFNVGNAMTRNKYIYCLSDAAIVIAATENKGGTWAGAMEDLQRDWVPLWIWRGNAADPIAGNQALVKKGANWLPDNFAVQQLSSHPRQTSQPEISTPAHTLSNNPYTLFISHLNKILHEKPLTFQEIKAAIDFKPKQISTWLKQAIAEGKVAKTRSPVKYNLCRKENFSDTVVSSHLDHGKAVQVAFGF